MGQAQQVRHREPEHEPAPIPLPGQHQQPGDTHQQTHHHTRPHAHRVAVTPCLHSDTAGRLGASEDEHQEREDAGDDAGSRATHRPPSLEFRVEHDHDGSGNLTSVERKLRRRRLDSQAASCSASFQRRSVSVWLRR